MNEPSGLNNNIPQSPPGVKPGGTHPPADNRSPGPVVQLIPAFFAPARVRGLIQPLRLWYILRLLNSSSGDGRLLKSEAIEQLHALGWSLPAIYRVLAKGMGVLWVEDPSSPPALRLRGCQAVAKAWGVDFIHPYTVEAPLDLLTSTRATWSALTYQAALPGPRRPTSRGQPRRNHPYSREKLRQDTLIPERSQRRYQHLTFPGTGLRVSKKAANFTTEVVELPGKSETWYGHRRLGNSYTSGLPRQGYGQARAYNDQQKKIQAQGGAREHGGPNELGAQSQAPSSRSFEVGNTVSIPRRYFDTAKSLLRCKQELIEPMLRVRHDPGWSNPYIGLWEEEPR